MNIDLYGANGKYQESIEIDREPSRFRGWDYTIYNRKARKQGFVEVRLKLLKEFQEYEPVTEPLVEIVDNEDEIIAEIQRFNPHGNKPIKPNLLRRGIGTFVLRNILTDVKDNGVSYVYCHNPRSGFYRILVREGFEELDVNSKEVCLFMLL